MKKRYAFAAVAAMVTLVVVLNQKSVTEKYATAVADHTAGSWHTLHVIQPSFVGVLLNAIPGFHLAGLLFDSLNVYQSIPEVILGNGALVAGARACPGLVQAEDEALFWAWEDGHQREVTDSFVLFLQGKHDNRENGAQFQRQLTVAAHQHMRSKVQQKMVSKVATKIGLKAGTKAVVGFVPLVGPVVAGIYNYVLLDGIHDHAIDYFQAKARLVCAIK